MPSEKIEYYKKDIVSSPRIRLLQRLKSRKIVEMV